MRTVIRFRGCAGWDNKEPIINPSFAMKKFLLLVSALSLIVAIVLAPLVAQAQSSAGSAKSAGAGPGAAFAQTITTVTGIAISPLLAMSAVGVWQFFRAPSEKRDQLPFYAQWWFWLPGLLIAGAAALSGLRSGTRY